MLFINDKGSKNWVPCAIINLQTFIAINSENERLQNVIFYEKGIKFDQKVKFLPITKTPEQKTTDKLLIENRKLSTWDLTIFY